MAQIDQNIARLEEEIRLAELRHPPTTPAEAAAQRTRQAAEQVAHHMQTAREQATPLSEARKRELLSLTPLGHAIVRRGDMQRARDGTPAPGGLSDARRRELLGMTASGNAQLVKEDVARAADGR